MNRQVSSPPADPITRAIIAMNKFLAGRSGGIGLLQQAVRAAENAAPSAFSLRSAPDRLFVALMEAGASKFEAFEVLAPFVNDAWVEEGAAALGVAA